MIPAEIIIHRLTGDAPGMLLIDLCGVSKMGSLE